MGGDEFGVVVTDVRSPRDAARAGEHIVAALRPPIVLPERELKVTVSIGISVFPVDGVAPDELLRRADRAMYRNKTRVA